jgi:methionyl-tRNA formyltransferase
VRLVFAGTGAFAVPSLRRLREAGHELALVLTQPDRPAGRGLQLRPSPVKEAALGMGLEVFQPARIRDPQALERIRAEKPEALVVAAYGQILPAGLLALPSLGALNVHASLLPRHRGPAPIQWTILMGDSTAGVTIMKMDAGVDTGPILRQRSIALMGDETAAGLESSLAELGADLLVSTLARLRQGSIDPMAQTEEGATHARRPTAADGDLDQDLTAVEIDRRVRALNPEPGCWITLGGARVKVLEGSLEGAPGAKGHTLRTREGTYVIRTVQPPGGKPMPVDAYLRGRR